MTRETPPNDPSPLFFFVLSSVSGGDASREGSQTESPSEQHFEANRVKSLPVVAHFVARSAESV